MWLWKTTLLYFLLFFFNSNAYVFSQATMPAQNPFTFTLATDSRTSAGVFKADGTLVRTIWSAVNFTAGEHTESWDGLLDNGNTAPVDNYQIKVLSGNVNYEWEGALIGNTSTALTGSTKLRFYDPLSGMAVANNTIYWAAGYNEGWPANYKTSITDPNTKTFIGPMKQTNQVSAFVCTDAVNVYWAGYDPFDANHESFVFATKVSDDTRVAFANGVPARMEWGSTYQNAIAYKNTAKATASLISGIAVQKTGNYLFVSRKGQNEMQVLNKSTGALVRTITITAPAVTQIDNNDNLWLAHAAGVQKYIVNADGSITSAGVSIPITNAGAIAISPDNATVIVADITTEQVKAYANNTGNVLWTLGTGESYITNATVKNDKFYWKDVRGQYATFLCFLPDGTFYVGDPQNRRAQHFSTNRTFIDKIMYLSSYYNAFADPNNPTRIFADFLEFKIDYTKPLRTSWDLVKNWGANISSAYDWFEKMKYAVTLSNGRTYARIRRVNEYSIIELAEGGSARFTNVIIPSFGMISKDGSLLTSSIASLGQSMTLRRLILNGFTNTNNPIWSATPQVIATTPAVTANDPVPWEGFRADPVTNLNKIIYFDYAKAEFGHGEGFHLGAININDNKWLWRTAPATFRTYTGPFPEDGAFDIGNGVVYAGGLALTSDQNIFWSYHGEFWKQSQTNKWNHVYDNGLMVGQFGELTSDYPGIEAFAGGAGNVRSGSVVSVNGITYLYHNDEGVHGALHRWKISGINTIQVQNAVFPTTKHYTPKEGIDLLEGLVRNTTLQNGSFGWQRTPATNNTTTGTYFTATTGNKTYDKFQRPDLFLKYRISSGTATVTRELGNNNGLYGWKLWGKVNFDEHTPNEARGRGGNYMEVLDKSNRIIARFYITRDMVSGTNIMGNSQVLYNGTATEIDVMKNKHQPIEISMNNGLLKISYASRTITTAQFVDPAADWRTPTTLRFQFFTNYVADDFARSIDIPELRFLANPMEVLPVTGIDVRAYPADAGIVVDWTNQQENDIEQYEIEKSIDGRQFSKIGMVMAGTPHIINKYKWLDSVPEQGGNYYRIKIINRAGTQNYSSIVLVNIRNEKDDIEIFPNPVSGDLFSVRFNNIPRGTYILTLINYKGQVMWKKNVYHADSNTNEVFPINFSFPSGKYKLSITGGKKTYFKQLLKLQ